MYGPAGARRSGRAALPARTSWPGPYKTTISRSITNDNHHTTTTTNNNNDNGSNDKCNMCMC